MKPGRYDIVLPQRATYSAEITLPINLAGHSVYAQMWSSDKRRIKVADFAIVIIDAANGVFKLELPWETTSNIRKPGVWDLLIVYPNGTRSYWLEGEVTIDVGLTTPPQ